MAGVTSPVTVTAPASPGVLTCRLLPAEEWPRLAAIEPFRSRGLPDDPESWGVLVVERDTPEGPQIVGTCSLFFAAHWDCWWIDPAQPGTTPGVVLRRLLTEALGSLTEAGVRQVYTGAEHDAPQVVDLLTRFGFHLAPGRLFVLPVAEAAEAFRKEG